MAKALAGEGLRFVTQNWDVLEMHFIQRYPAREIAWRCNMKPESVSRIVSAAWVMGITRDDIQNYMSR